MTSKSILRCLSLNNDVLKLIQLRNLRLHSSIRLWMGTADTQEAQDTAKAQAEEFVQRRLLSGQAIQFGRTYALRNICMDGIFVSELVVT